MGPIDLNSLPTSLLGPQHLSQIQNALVVIANAEQHVDQAARAGIDVSAQRAQLTDAKSKLLQLKQVYFPGQ